MKLAMEIPTQHLEEISKHTDFDYALAHEVFKSGPDGEYTQFYRAQHAKKREVWLDNGVNELGTPMSAELILEAAEMINATHVIAPDHFDDGDRTIRELYNMKEILKNIAIVPKLIGVWQGFKKDLRKTMQLADICSLPYRKMRDRMMVEPEFDSKDFHYLGFRTLDELRRFPPMSIDTSMPIRAALYGIDLSQRDRRPNTPGLDISQKLSPSTILKAISNINLIREAGKWSWEKSPTGTQS